MRQSDGGEGGDNQEAVATQEETNQEEEREVTVSLLVLVFASDRVVLPGVPAFSWFAALVVTLFLELALVDRHCCLATAADSSVYLLSGPSQVLDRRRARPPRCPLTGYLLLLLLLLSSTVLPAVPTPASTYRFLLPRLVNLRSSRRC